LELTATLGEFAYESGIEEEKMASKVTERQQLAGGSD
jgi:hypothetical protein